MPATQTHSPKPASAQKRGLPLPCHACQNVRGRGGGGGNRGAARVSKGDMCEAEGDGSGATRFISGVAAE